MQAAPLVTLVVFAFVAFVLWLVAAHIRAKIRHRTEVQKELIAKFSSPQELADFLNSEAGKLLIRGAKDDTTAAWKEPAARPPNEQIGIAIGWGVLVLCVGAAVVVVRGLTLPGAVITALGIGLLFNALLRAWFFWKRGA
jgi:Flp pilus assembly protein TadB